MRKFLVVIALLFASSFSTAFASEDPFAGVWWINECEVGDTVGWQITASRIVSYSQNTKRVPIRELQYGSLITILLSTDSFNGKKAIYYQLPSGEIVEQIFIRQGDYLYRYINFPKFESSQKVRKNDPILRAYAPQSLADVKEGQKFDTLHRCPNREAAIKKTPVIAALAFTMQIEKPCQDTALQCAESVFGVADVTEDGNLSKAELSRAIRMVGFVESAAARKPSKEISHEEYLLASSVAATAVAPLIAQNVIDSFDYDANGQLSLGELLTDYDADQMQGVFQEMSNNFSAGLLTKLASLLPSIF